MLTNDGNTQNISTFWPNLQFKNRNENLEEIIFYRFIFWYESKYFVVGTFLHGKWQITVMQSIKQATWQNILHPPALPSRKDGAPLWEFPSTLLVFLFE